MRNQALPRPAALPIVFPGGQPSIAELQPQLLVIGEQAGDQGRPLGVIDLVAGAARYVGDRHAQRRRHYIGRHAEFERNGNLGTGNR
jgi:hypothetical protein